MIGVGSVGTRFTTVIAYMTAEHMHVAVGSGSDRADEEYREEEEDGVGTGLDLAHLQATADPWDEVYRVANG